MLNREGYLLERKLRDTRYQPGEYSLVVYDRDYVLAFYIHRILRSLRVGQVLTNPDYQALIAEALDDYSDLSLANPHLTREVLQLYRSRYRHRTGQDSSTNLITLEGENDEPAEVD